MNDLINFFKDLDPKLKNYHLTFIIFQEEYSEPIISTFSSDNAKYFKDWWFMQCIKLSNRTDFVVHLNKREFTKNKDKVSGHPIKKLSSCVFRNGGVQKLSAIEIGNAWTIEHKTGKTLPTPTDIVFVDYI